MWGTDALSVELSPLETGARDRIAGLRRKVLGRPYAASVEFGTRETLFQLRTRRERERKRARAQVATGAELSSKRIPRNVVTCMAWLPEDEHCFAQGSEDLTLRVFPSPRLSIRACFLVRARGHRALGAARSGFVLPTPPETHTHSDSRAVHVCVTGGIGAR